VLAVASASIYTFGTPMTYYAVRVVSTVRNFFMTD
jgi:hypothetical protein